MRQWLGIALLCSAALACDDDDVPPTGDASVPDASRDAPPTTPLDASPPGQLDASNDASSASDASGDASFTDATTGTLPACHLDTECTVLFGVDLAGCAFGTCVAGACESSVITLIDADNDDYVPCTLPAQITTTKKNGDCDDADPATHPDAFDGVGYDNKGTTLYCDGKDNDCSGLSDDYGYGPYATFSDACRCDSGIPSYGYCDRLPDGTPIFFPTLNGNAAGSCRSGRLTCINNRWSAPCVGAIPPKAYDRCETPDADDNCNRRPNEGCTCAAGQTTTCRNKIGASVADCLSSKVITCTNGIWPIDSQCLGACPN